jgi:hypothetical protein
VQWRREWRQMTAGDSRQPITAERLCAAITLHATAKSMLRLEEPIQCKRAGAGCRPRQTDDRLTWCLWAGFAGLKAAGAEFGRRMQLQGWQVIGRCLRASGR